MTNTGYGIEADALPHIFDRYYQAKGKHQASGSGIGLALVKSLSELHEAILTVESKPGVGTTFRLLLLRDNTYPMALHKEFEDEKKSETVAEIDSDVTPGDNARPLVLVVEDNESIRDYIQSSLTDKFRLLVAADGKEGLELARKEIPDIVISDIMMPVMDGIELCRHIKKDINTSHIPVVLLTAKDSIQDKEEGYESGADSYLTKPFSAKLLISRINNILESRNRKIKSLAGVSGNEFIRKIRLRHGYEFLEQGCNVTEAAFSCGFGDVKHFRNSFKEEYGVTPSQFIKELKIKSLENTTER